MKVNGKNIEFKENLTVIDLLNKYNLKSDRVVVEINLEIVEESNYNTYILKDEDVVELIGFIGGG
ncbi:MULTISPECIES: sulfur carrier protein ThiS [unclassified Clostridioides]|uniref:sulfur carrier protein ThiS n=1 Tax=unclassified Clostridioides TaxID=2635829 RepID=UPI001D12CF23|nr:sulfur carrier protein ThiS [Clostridioides sp. ZZV15-6388]MCC0644990.1 sulfur carrier protein ThiS [Clostridioides sp. ZZV14-6150]MCC0659189.1 sulfur carrier protein ThiS [Clostridioides sp. ZZV14-6154]MCC0665326.1 sulfur carrier protein ThiS [Clostridioides sp. ZZV15-6597]MCC0668430.1 sulfur carrier protein ThiS [Clostridioides sp. ZZV14-6153]MCC0720177.1 sulfur carrier protein ThiS [Clostridioides sp. ZZV14-6105]MCC0722254.1 sulfur carrier protein ThiS [Clostridioides sp. ZZV14-6104]MC